MPPMAQTLSQIKALLADHGLHPKKKLGQNFLHDGNHMRAILAAAAPGRPLTGSPDHVDHILEVGAGTGALTERLLDADPAVRVVAVEIDADLEPILRQRLSPRADRVRVLIADVLTGKRTVNPAVLDALAAQSQIENQISKIPFKLVANLPYQIASPLLVNLAVDHPQMGMAVVMVQREVAERILAPPGGKAYGPLSVMIQAMCEVERVAVLAPGCFWPAPKVESAVLKLTRRATPATDDPAALGAVVHRLFGQRRKQIGTILGRARSLPPGIEPTGRPERLSVEQLAALARWLGSESAGAPVSQRALDGPGRHT